MPRFSRGGEDVKDWMLFADSKGEIKYSNKYFKEIQNIIFRYRNENDEYWSNVGEETMCGDDEEIMHEKAICGFCGQECYFWQLHCDNGKEDAFFGCLWCEFKQNLRYNSIQVTDPRYKYRLPQIYENPKDSTTKTRKEQEEYIDSIITKIKLHSEIDYHTIYGVECENINDLLKPKNKRIKKEMEKELMSIVDNPHKLLGKLCIRMDAMELNEEWKATDFPNIPCYA